MKVWHSRQLKKSKSWGRFWSYQLNSSANSAHLQQKWAKWNELAVLFSLVAPGFWFFQLPWVPNLHFSWNALLPKHLESWHDNLFLSGVCTYYQKLGFPFWRVEIWIQIYQYQQYMQPYFSFYYSFNTAVYLKLYGIHLWFHEGQ